MGNYCTRVKILNVGGNYLYLKLELGMSQAGLNFTRDLKSAS